MANKSFSSSDSDLAKNTEAAESLEQRAFITKSYFDDGSTAKNHSTLNLDAKFSPPALDGYSHGATGLDKNYPVGNTDVTLNKSTAFASHTSDYQNRTAILGTEKTATFASTLNNKPYLGPEGPAVRHEMDEVNNGLIQLKDLPSRPLTIDEVRNLINHGVTPDTDAKPEPPTKALNDPDYKPEPSPGPPVEEDSDESVPSPGTMAAQPLPAPPENSEPLPGK